MKFNSLREDSEKFEQPSIWSRVGNSAVYVAFIYILFLLLSTHIYWVFSTLLESIFSVPLLNFFLIELAILLPGFAFSLIFPHRHFLKGVQLKNRLWVSYIYLVIIVVLDFTLPFYFHGVSQSVVYGALFIGLTLSLVLPHLKYKRSVYSFLILVCWVSLLAFVMQILSV